MLVVPAWPGKTLTEKHWQITANMGKSANIGFIEPVRIVSHSSRGILGVCAYVQGAMVIWNYVVCPLIGAQDHVLMQALIQLCSGLDYGISVEPLLIQWTSKPVLNFDGGSKLESRVCIALDLLLDLGVGPLELDWVWALWA